MILNDKQIKKLVEEQDMINPFVDKSIAQGISHGLNSFGFDLRCGDEFKIFTNIKGATADPKNFTEDNCKRRRLYINTPKLFCISK